VPEEVDRTGWPPGPWDQEPDFSQWVDVATGLVCFARRHPYWGTWCGYVCVPRRHPAYGLAVGAADDLDVHGGVTHVGAAWDDGVGPETEPGDLWILGFDTLHARDLPPGSRNAWPGRDAAYRTLAYVQDQCHRLAAQLGRTPPPGG